MRDAVKKIVAEADIKTLSRKSVKEELQKSFSADAIKAQKDHLKKWVDQYFDERTKKDDGAAMKD